MTAWEIHGREIGNCNCAFGCPCQFLALPTHGTCEAAAGFVFDSGHHGSVDLGGTRAAMVLKWPGAIHEGNGTMQIIIDDSTTPDQRQALERIMTGEDTDEMATMWWVFSAMSPNKLETLYRPVSISCDVRGRKGSFEIPGVVQVEAEPITNPVTGAEHRASINLPGGFEFSTCEIAKGTTKTTGAIDLPNNKGTHSHLAELHLSQSGVIPAAA